MGKISQMISVRTLLHKMRTHAVVSVLSAAALVAALCGYVIFVAMERLESSGGDTFVQEGDQVLYSVTEEVDAQMLLQTEEVSGQLEVLRLSLTDLHGKVDAGAGAVSSIEGMLGNMTLSDPATGQAVIDASTHLTMLQTEITNAFDKIEAVSVALSTYDARDEERGALLISQMEDVNQTMVWISEHYASVSEEILRITEELKSNASFADAGIVAGVASLEEAMNGSVTEFTAAALQLTCVSAELKKSMEELFTSLDMSTEVATLQTGVDEANRKLDLLLAGMGNEPQTVQPRAVPVTGDAAAWQVLSGRTFLGTSGEDAVALTGTMPDHSDIGAVTLEAGETYTFEEGYYPAFTVSAPAAGASLPSLAGSMRVYHHVHSNVSTTETTETGSMDITADGPSDSHLSMTYGGCYTADGGEHVHTSACYSTKTERVAVDPCPGYGSWSGPYGPDSQGREYYVADCAYCGARVGTSYTPVSGGIPGHSRGKDHTEYTDKTTTSVICGMSEGKVYAIDCGHTRGEVTGYTVSFE